MYQYCHVTVTAERYTWWAMWIEIVLLCYMPLFLVLKLDFFNLRRSEIKPRSVCAGHQVSKPHENTSLTSGGGSSVYVKSWRLNNSFSWRFPRRFNLCTSVEILDVEKWGHNALETLQPLNSKFFASRDSCHKVILSRQGWYLCTVFKPTSIYVNLVLPTMGLTLYSLT